MSFRALQIGVFIFIICFFSISLPIYTKKTPVCFSIYPSKPLCWPFGLQTGVRGVYAQESPSVTPASSNDTDLQKIIDEFLENINRTLFNPYIQSQTPPALEIPPSPLPTFDPHDERTKGVSDDVGTNTSFNYGVGSVLRGPGEANLNRSFFDEFLSKFGIGTGDYSKEKGQKFMNSFMPYEGECNEVSCFSKARCTALPYNEGCESVGMVLNKSGPTLPPSILSITPIPTVNQTPSVTLPVISVTPTPGVANLTYFSQCDGRWADHPDDAIMCGGVRLDVKHAGCGPTSIAMILSANISSDLTPDKVWDQVSKLGGIVCEKGTGGGLVRGTIGTYLRQVLENPDYNFKTAYVSYPPMPDEVIGIVDQAESIKLMRRYLQDGWQYIIANTNQYGGHFLLVTDVSEDGVVTVYDPYSACGPNGTSGPTTLLESVEFQYGFTVVKKETNI